MVQRGYDLTFPMTAVPLGPNVFQSGLPTTGITPVTSPALWDLSGYLTGVPGQLLWTRSAHDITEICGVVGEQLEWLRREGWV